LRGATPLQHIQLPERNPAVIAARCGEISPLKTSRCNSGWWLRSLLRISALEFPCGCFGRRFAPSGLPPPNSFNRSATSSCWARIARRRFSSTAEVPNQGKFSRAANLPPNRARSQARRVVLGNRFRHAGAPRPRSALEFWRMPPGPEKTTTSPGRSNNRR
jgi:hypothetical protein